MKKNLLFASLLLSSLSFGQIIQSGDSLTLGDSQLYYRADTSTAELENTVGANVTWDFSDLLMEYGTASSTNEVIDISASPYAADFPNAQYHEDFPNGIQSFFSNDGNNLYIEGFVFANAGVDYRVVYDDDNLLAMTRPVALNDLITDDIEGTAFAPYLGQTITADLVGTAVTKADGEGTLILAGNTYSNTIRIKTIENSAGAVTGFPGQTVSVLRRSFSYYSSSTTDHFPLLVVGTVAITIPGGGVVKQKIVWTRDNSAAYLSNDDKFENLTMDIYPNPADQNITVTTSNLTETIEIFNTVGKLVSTVNNPGSTEVINISALSAGVYFVSVKGNGQTKTDKLIVK
ncbi:MAG: T9SS type A sorting domain-containing protein [Crocinitomicaceae bacterium]